MKKILFIHEKWPENMKIDRQRRFTDSLAYQSEGAWIHVTINMSRETYKSKETRACKRDLQKSKQPEITKETNWSSRHICRKWADWGRWMVFIGVTCRVHRRDTTSVCVRLDSIISVTRIINVQCKESLWLESPPRVSGHCIQEIATVCVSMCEYVCAYPLDPVFVFVLIVLYHPVTTQASIQNMTLPIGNGQTMQQVKRMSLWVDMLW